MKIVINTCFGGYSLSKEAYEYLGLKWDNYGFAFDSDRSNPDLIKCIESLGKKANGFCADLKIVETENDDSMLYVITEYDGKESIESIYDLFLEKNIKVRAEEDDLDIDGDD